MLAAGAAQAAAGYPGEVKFERHARSDFMPFLTDSTTAQRTWMRNTYWRMQSYSPWFDSSLSWAPPSYFYLDLYALHRDDHPADQELMQQHPDWVLRDGSGKKLYIPFGCDDAGAGCPQYAADVGNPQWRAHWIEIARSHMSQGYRGIFVDDVNLERMVSDGDGNLVAPIDPRTGQPMTGADWRRYMAEFTEEIRAAFPDREIIHNGLWWMDHDDPYVQREVAAADYIEMERGFNDSGMSGGNGQWSYKAYMAHADWLHSRGVGVIFEPYGLNAQSAAFELASYLLVNNGDDSIASEYRANPTNWWSGWETDLGAASGNRYSWQGLLRRDFAGGLALTNEPGAPTRTVQLPSGTQWTDLNGNVVTSVTLGARQGAVLRSSSTPDSEEPPPSEDPPPNPPQDSPPPSGGSGSGSGGSGGSTQPGVTAPSASQPAPTITVNRSKVKRGRKLVLSGEASASSVEVRAYIDGSWQVVAEDDSVTAGDYSVKLKATAPGVVQFKAAAPGLPESEAISVKIKG